MIGVVSDAETGVCAGTVSGARHVSAQKGLLSLVLVDPVVLVPRPTGRGKSCRNISPFGDYPLYLLVPDLVGSIVVVHVKDALVPQLPLVHLKSEEGEDHEAENRERHDLRQLLERMQECVDDGLQT